MRIKNCPQQHLLLFFYLYFCTYVKLFCETKVNEYNSRKLHLCLRVTGIANNGIHSCFETFEYCVTLSNKAITIQRDIFNIQASRLNEYLET